MRCQVISVPSAALIYFPEVFSRVELSIYGSVLLVSSVHIALVLFGDPMETIAGKLTMSNILSTQFWMVIGALSILPNVRATQFPGPVCTSLDVKLTTPCRLVES